ncbi:MAG: N-acetyltransferase, partial [Ignavibacteria bacterium]
YIPAEVIKNEKMMSKLERMADIIKSRQDIVTRKLKLKDLSNEVRKIEEIYNNAWEMNWGFVPMTSEEFDYVANTLKAVVDPDFVIFAEVNGVPAGFSLSLPDINQVLKRLNGKLFPFGIFKFISGKKKINLLRVIIMGVKKEFQKKGIDSVFYLETIKEGNRKGYKGAEISWVLEDNTLMKQTAEKLGAHIYKTYRIYSKNIN